MKNLIKIFFNYLGLEVHRLQPSSDSISQIIKAMNMVKTNIVLDLGANTGQFAQEIRRKGYSGKIISFEPLTDARKILLENASKDSKWFVHSRVAIGDKKGNIKINKSKNSVSSSILPMLKSHSDDENNSVYIGSENVLIITLDSIFNSYVKKNSNCFIKIDTQGYEWQILNGAKKSLKKAKGIICELSLVHLYKGQFLYKDIITRLEKEGFVLWSLIRGFTSESTGQTMQLDGVFLKKKVINKFYN